jgi:hypothetical protein
LNSQTDPLHMPRSPFVDLPSQGIYVTPPYEGTKSTAPLDAASG